MLVRLLFIIIGIALFSSCKTYVLPLDTFKAQYSSQSISNDTVSFPGSTVTVIKNAPTTFNYIDYGKTRQIHLDSSKKIIVRYSISNFLPVHHRLTLNYNEFFLKKDSLKVLNPSYTGIFQNKKILSVDIKQINKVKIKNFNSLDNRILIKTTPFSLVNFFDGPSYKIALEFKFIKNTSLEIGLGNFLSYSKENGSNGKGIIINPEIKYYLNHNNQSLGRYIALDYNYKDQVYGWSDTVITKQGSVIQKEYKNYTIHKFLNTVNLKYGILRVYKNIFVVDYFFGIGIKFKNTSSTLTTEEANSIIYTGDYGGGYVPVKNEIGTFVYPNFTAGLKLGFKVK
jgi:hypothetical protein